MKPDNLLFSESGSTLVAKRSGGVKKKSNSRSPAESKHPTTIKGGKNKDGVWQFFANIVPPHTTKYECFAGTAFLTRLLKPCERSYVVEIDSSLVKKYNFGKIPGVVVLNEDAIDVLYAASKLERTPPDKVFVYCDPEYPLASKTTQKHIYKYPYTDADHRRLCQLLVTLRFKVAISSYRNALYDEILKGWHRIDFEQHIRRGSVTESVYMNYVITNGQLHDYRQVGENNQRRWKLKSTARSIIRRINSLKPEEKNSLLYRIQQAFPELKSDI